MHWNYRIARKRNERVYKDTIKVYYEYFIVEAYCDDNGKVGMITVDPQALYGENVEHLADGFIKMKKAFYAPILDYDSIPEIGYQENDTSITMAIDSEDLFKKLNEEEIEEEIEKEDMLKITENEILDYDKQCENERVQKENLFNHLIREFMYDVPESQIKLEDFYKKD